MNIFEPRTFSTDWEIMVVDKLERFQPLGWYGVAGWSLYRPESLIVAQSSSTARPTA